MLPTAVATALAAFLAIGLARPAGVAAYSVQSGDTLWVIAKKTGVSIDAIVRANHLADPNLIYPGQNLVIPGPSAAAGTSYTVAPGDSIWSIAHALHVSVPVIISLNHLDDPNLILPGQHLQLPGTAPASLPAPGPRGTPPTPPISLAAARALLVQAAHDQGLNPAFVLAVSYWESGFNQGWVSGDGAVGMMQILPVTAAWAGPALLGRAVDLQNPKDNAELGAALLRRYLDHFQDPKLAIAAYYQGAAATEKYGIYDSSQAYVNGIWALRNQFNAGLR